MSILNASQIRRCLGAIACVLVLSTEGLQNASADGDTRTLTLHHTHRDDTLTVTFKRGGRYDEAGLAKLNYFLRDWRNDAETKMDPRLFDTVWEVYQDVDGSAPIQIVSAYRSPATNSMLRRRSRGVAQFSQHMLGKAMDFFIPGVSLERIRAAGLRQQRGGVGFYPTSGSPFVHLDVGSVRHWPRMTHDQLVRVFPNGRTVHVPSDGHPLPGYELALADIQQRGSSMPSRLSLAALTNGGSGKPGFLSRLFGAKDDEEETEQPRGRQRRPTAVAAAETQDEQPAKTAASSAAPSVMASAIPMPRARPGRSDPAGRDVVAALAPVREPAVRTRPASANTTPSAAEVVQERGIWHGSQAVERQALASAEPQPKAAPRERLAWTVGPQPVSRPGATFSGVTISGGTPSGAANSDSTSVAVKSAPTPAPRPRPPVRVASAIETTGTLPPWPTESADSRLPRDIVMAYAASGTEQVPAASPVTNSAAAPMGTLRSPPAASRQPASRQALGQASRQQPRSGALLDNPWLRGIIMAPSIQDSMAVTVLGAPNYLELARLMHKPPAAIVNTFGADPEFGLTATRFGGSAIAVLPTVRFTSMTVGMR